MSTTLTMPRAKVLAGERVLLVCPATFGYNLDLRDELRAMGAEVELFSETTDSIHFGLARRLGPRGLASWRRPFARRLLRRARVQRFDRLLIVRGEQITPATLAELRRLQPHAQCVLYEWDSLRKHDYRPLAELCDRVVSFDRADCEAEGYVYQPLFFHDRFVPKSTVEPDIDVLFVGTIHSDRPRIAGEIREQAERAGLTSFMYIFVPLLGYLKQNKKDPHWQRIRSFAHVRSLSKLEIVSLMHRSRTVLDVEASHQTGLTMRTLESLGAGRKLITTNTHIRREPFYRPDVIQVIDRAHPTLDIDFVRTPVPPCDMAASHLSAWLPLLLGIPS